MDFDDLLLLTVKLLNEHAEVRERWQRRFRYLMVDEFQDTNRLQLELVTLPRRTRAQERRVVGDDDQSIYGWRGAEVSNILEFEAHFPNPAVVKLEQNYRSTNAILGHGERAHQKQPAPPPEAALEREGRRREGAHRRDDATTGRRREFIANEIQQPASSARR